MNWINSAQTLPLNNGKYLVYYSQSKEHVICDYDGNRQAFSYLYRTEYGDEMQCDFYVNKSLWWQYLTRPE